jgi:alpha-tubulin suppressor-like RCC1 family protein
VFIVEVVAITAGASLSAALTARGNVAVWGNLRDGRGSIDRTSVFSQMQREPTVICQGMGIVKASL